MLEQKQLGVGLDLVEQRRELVGELAPIPAVMSGDLAVEGDMEQLLTYSDATALLGEVAADMETTHLF